MKLRELKEKIDALVIEYPKFLDSKVLVDTEAAEFTVHMVDITNIYSEHVEDIGEDMVYLTLDNEVKLHRPNDCKRCNYYKMVEEAIEAHNTEKQNERKET
jgi:hypothetical protein